MYLLIYKFNWYLLYLFIYTFFLYIYRDFSNTINIIRTLGKLNYSKMNDNGHLNEKLNIVFKKNVIF